MTDKYLYPINGIISRTVTSNNLTVAIKNFDGSDFSSSAPLVHKIGDTPRSLSSSLSVTVNAEANTFNAGANELATKEIDYFTYLGWRASNSSMFVIASRIPYATTYADFSVTGTSEKYGAYSGAAPASTDPVVNIGRFNATLSSGTYNWSVPSTSEVINQPIFETRWLDWGFVPTGFSANPTNTVHRYRITQNTITLMMRHGLPGTSNATTFTLLSPFTSANITNAQWTFACTVDDNSVFLTTPGLLLLNANSNSIAVYKDWSVTGGGAAWTASGGKRVRSGILSFEI